MDGLIDIRKKINDNTILVALFVAVLAVISYGLFYGESFSVFRNKPEEITQTVDFGKVAPYLFGLGTVGALIRSLQGRFTFVLSDLFALLATATVLTSFLVGKTLPPFFDGFLFCIGLYFLGRIFMSENPLCLNVFLVWLLVVGVAEASLGIAQIYGFKTLKHSLGVSGTLFNPGPYGGFIAMLLAFATTFVVRSKVSFATICLRNLRKTLCFEHLIVALSYFYIVEALLVLPSTLSRAAWLGAVGGLLVLLVTDKRALPRIKAACKANYRRTVGVVCLGVMVLSVAAFGAYRFKKESADGRLLIWKISWGAALEKPLTGYGMGRFCAAFGQRHVDYFHGGEVSSDEVALTGKTGYAFNEPLQIAIELGMIAALGGVVWGVLLVVWGFRSPNIRYTAISAALLVLLLFGLASYPLNIALFQCTAALMAGAIASRGGLRFRWFPLGVTLPLLVWSVGFSRTAQSYREAFRAWGDENRYYTMNIYDEKMAIVYGQIADRLRYHSDFLFEYGHILNKLNRYEQSNEILLCGTQIDYDPMFYNIMGNNYRALGAYDKAEESYLTAYYSMPHRQYPLYLLFNLVYDRGDKEKSRQIANWFFSITPKVKTTAFKQMSREINEKLTLLSATDDPSTKK